MTDRAETGEVTLFRRAKAIIGESLWWNAGTLEWCDITNGLLTRSPLEGSPDGADDDVLAFAPPLAAFQPTADGGYVIAGGDSVFRCDRDGSNVRELASVKHRHSGLRFNESKCDPFGNFVVGSMNVTGDDPDGAIYVVAPDGEVRTLLGGLGVANGFEWSDDGSRMWFTDTAVKTIFVGDYDGASLTNVESFSIGRQSDGLARAADGTFWNGVYDEGIVVHLDADGTVLRKIDIPAGHVTSVAFGGDDLSTLYIATARENLAEEQLEQQPLTGSIFSIQTSTRGLPVRAFGTR